MASLNPKWVDRAYLVQIDGWLWNEWGYARGWSKRLPEMILWYSTAGAAFLSGAAADTFVERARNAQRLPRPRRRVLIAAQKLARRVCQNLGSNPVDWFTGGCGDMEAAWNDLDAIPGIGPKIASFIMRDLSFMRDYSRGLGGTGVSYRRSAARSWFDRLPFDVQALFVPIDRYVHKAARRSRVSPLFRRCTVAKLQSDAELHRRAATDIVRWCRARGLDPRDVDVYWYATGQGYVRRDGTRAEQ
jgi:hypothetical protein